MPCSKLHTTTAKWDISNGTFKPCVCPEYLESKFVAFVESRKGMLCSQPGGGVAHIKVTAASVYINLRPGSQYCMSVNFPLWPCDPLKSPSLTLWPPRKLIVTLWPAAHGCSRHLPIDSAFNRGPTPCENRRDLVSVDALVRGIKFYSGVKYLRAFVDVTFAREYVKSKNLNSVLVYKKSNREILRHLDRSVAAVVAANFSELIIKGYALCSYTKKFVCVFFYTAGRAFQVEVFL